MKTKTKMEMSNYIYSLALQCKEKLENEDIELCISVLTQEEKQILKSNLQRLKIETKNPVDYQINRKIYRAIAIIMDKTNSEDKQEKEKRESLKKQYQDSQKNKPFQDWTKI